MSIHLVLVTYALDVRPLVESINGPDITWHLFLHSERVRGLCNDLVRDYPNIDYYPYGTNRGLARSWNDGIVAAQEANADVTIVLNDDLTMSRADLDVFIEAALSHREAGLIIADGTHGDDPRLQSLSYGIFAINPIALDTVGYFDVNYWPIYGEDVDYSVRLARCGLTFYNAGPTAIHHLNNATLKAVPALHGQNQVTFPRNQDYHIQKWGGPYNHEVYEVPFNDPAFGWQIAASQRHDPYPGHLRNDIGG